MREVLRTFIDEGGDFNQVALELYRWQRAHNPEYDRFCGVADPARWFEIPAVPTTLFRDLGFTSFPAAEAEVVFHTSGTTTGRPGRVALLDTCLYDLGARLHAQACLGPLPECGVSLVSAQPTSSLGHMCRSFVPDMPHFFSLEGGVDGPGAWAAIREAAQGGKPVFLPATAFALADLLDHPAAVVQLPEGSIVMLTGGFKGRREEVAADALLEAIAHRLPGARVVGVAQHRPIGRLRHPLRHHPRHRRRRPMLLHHPRHHPRAGPVPGPAPDLRGAALPPVTRLAQAPAGLTTARPSVLPTTQPIAPPAAHPHGSPNAGPHVRPPVLPTT